MNKKIIQIVIIVLLLTSIILCGILLFTKNSSKITELEEITIKNTFESSSLYIETVERKEEEFGDIYIAYALYYSYNEYDNNTLTIDEVDSIVNEVFNVKLDKEKLKIGAITPTLTDYFISYNVLTEEYTLNLENKNNANIALTEIPVYLYESVTKKDDKFIVICKKYIISNPYEVLNYYIDLNAKEDSKIKYDTSKILDYLKGNAKVNVIKNVITSDMVDQVSKFSKTLEITYVLKDGKLLINSIS